MHDGRESARRASSKPGSPWAWWPKRKFSPIETSRAPSAPTSTSSMNSAAERCGELGVERDHDQLLPRPAPAISSALRSSVVSSFGVCCGATTETGCGSNVSTLSAPVDHLAVAEVHAVEGADGDAARSRGARRRAGGSPSRPQSLLRAPASSAALRARSARRARATALATRRRSVRRRRRVRPRTARSPCAGAPGSRRRRGRRSASARRCPSRTRSRRPPAAARGIALDAGLAPELLEARAPSRSARASRSSRRGARAGRRARRRS